MQAADTKDVEDAWSKTGGDVVIIAEANWHHILDAFLMCTPTIDGVLIPQNPMVALPAGNFTKGVPILLGTNQNEGSTFVYAALEKALNPILFDLAMDLLFGKVGEEVVVGMDGCALVRSKCESRIHACVCACVRVCVSICCIRGALAAKQTNAAKILDFYAVRFPAARNTTPAMCNKVLISC